VSGALVSALVLVLFATPASSVSRTHFARAQKLFAQERYRQALDEFTAASEKAPEEIPDLYFNIGQCHRNLGQLRQARIAFEHYLALRPDAADRKQVVALLAMLGGRAPVETVEQTEEPSAPAPVEPPVEVATTPTATATPVAVAPSEAPSAVRPELVASEPPAPRSEVHRRRWPIWVGVAAGTVAIGLGVGLGVYYGTAASSHAATVTPAPAPMLGSTVMFDTRGH
jgi:tetratricopeptide (TPR) repeat protein